MTIEQGPYIYRKPVIGEVLEHPFRVPEWEDSRMGAVDVWTELLDDSPGSWIMESVDTVKEFSVWRRIESPTEPTELLELAKKFRKETA